MWQARITPLGKGDVVAYQIEEHHQVMSYQQVIAAWIHESSFRSFFNQVLQDSPFEGFFWEVKPVNTATLASLFEFVLINSPFLSKVGADEQPFKTHFKTATPIVTFENLGRDAQLIVPTPAQDCAKQHYAHLANFVRNAPPSQTDALWQSVGEVYQQAIQEKPKWLSTSGLGVYWLHIRIDTKPKYYHHTAFKEWVD